LSSTICATSTGGRPWAGCVARRDLDKLTESGKLFALKFDTSVDVEILDLLDAHIDHARVGVRT